MINHVFISFTAIKIYDTSCIRLYSSPSTGIFSTNSQRDQLPVGLIAQLVEQCAGIAEVMGLKPVQAWIFFQALISQMLIGCVSNCDDQSCLYSVDLLTFSSLLFFCFRILSWMARDTYVCRQGLVLTTVRLPGSTLWLHMKLCSHRRTCMLLCFPNRGQSSVPRYHWLGCSSWDMLMLSNRIVILWYPDKVQT